MATAGARGGVAPLWQRLPPVLLRYVLQPTRIRFEAGRAYRLVEHHQPLYPQPHVAADCAG
ncbi:MAG: hypothetical protein U0401_06340 [Anaerolineae bacterium]